MLPLLSINEKLCQTKRIPGTQVEFSDKFYASNVNSFIDEPVYLNVMFKL